MKGKFKLNHLIVHLILLVGVIVVVFPFAWMILTSFKTSGEAMKIPPTIFPEKFVTTAYHTIVTSAIPFATVYMNTIITTVVTTLVQIVFCSMAGYAFGRIEFPFKNAIFILVLSVLILYSGVICTDGTWTDLPSATVSDRSETGTAGYDPGTVSAKPV